VASWTASGPAIAIGHLKHGLVSQLLPYGVATVLVALVLIWVAKQFFGEFIKILAGRRPDGSPRSFARGRRFTRRQLTRYRKSIRDDFHAHRPGFTGETVIDINAASRRAGQWSFHRTDREASGPRERQPVPAVHGCEFHATHRAHLRDRVLGCRGDLSIRGFQG
jgi:hypothetical protein